MPCSKSIVLAFFFAVIPGLMAVYAQSGIDVSWEIRNYYLDPDDPTVEIFITIRDDSRLDSGTEKTLVFFGPGEAREMLQPGNYRLSAWYRYANSEYKASLEKGSVIILKQAVEYSRDVRDFIPVAPGWREIMKIPIAAGRNPVQRPCETVVAKNLYSRPLSLQTKRMHGDDVWALQRFLVEQGYTEIGGIDGWFGPNTEKAVRRFQKNREVTVDGIVSRNLWDMLSGIDESQVNFFEGDYGD